MQHQKSLGIQSCIFGKQRQICCRFRTVRAGPFGATSTPHSRLIPGWSLIKESEANSCRSRLSPFGVTEIAEIVHAKGRFKNPALAIFLDKLALPNLDRSSCQIGKGNKEKCFFRFPKDPFCFTLTHWQGPIGLFSKSTV